MPFDCSAFQYSFLCANDVFVSVINESYPDTRSPSRFFFRYIATVLAGVKYTFSPNFGISGIDGFADSLPGGSLINLMDLE